MQKPDLGYLFEPRSIAIVGASENPGKVGYKVLSNIITDGYKGKVYPVNPKGGEILGVPCYKRLEDIPGEVDVASIVIPANIVYDAVMSCAAKGVKFLEIITSGFSEIGNVEEERKIVGLARQNGMRILGPNIFGMYSAGASLNATFGPKNIRAGNIAIITQSGALGVAMMGKTAVENMGLSTIISVGNKTDIDEADLLEYLVKRDDTKIIMMYIEGVREGERFIEVLNRTTRIKPIVVIKSGRSTRGAAAAASHTGSLAGSDDIFDAVMKQCRVLRAETVEDALAWCKFLAESPMPKGENTLIVTNGGGIGVMATDACEKFGVKLYDDMPALKAAFSPVMPYFGSTKNPIDLTGQASAANYNTAFGAALKMESVHAVISLYCETAVLDAGEFVPILEGRYKQYHVAGKPLVFCLFGGRSAEEVVKALRDRGIPVFTDPYEAVSCMGALFTYSRNRALEPEVPEKVELDVGRINELIAKARADGRRHLFPAEGRVLMEVGGLPIPTSSIGRDLGECVKAAEDIGYPVVMKVVSRDILHKSDVGGVVLDLENQKEVIEAYEAILYNCRTRKPNAVIEGMEIAEMVRPGVELIVGARRDPSFGPVVMAGLGGIYVEVMKDVSFRALPLGKRELTSMLKNTRSYPLLLGARGEERKDIESVLSAILKVGEIISSCPGISDVEVNPLRVYPDGIKAVDVRVMLSKGEGDAHE